jgi:pimeloyl-ACP methyl ester carboxylesterase
MKLVKISLMVVLVLASSIASAGVYCGQKFPVGTSYVPYCSNKKFGPAVFVIHGKNRNADDYLDYLDDLDTLVIAPEFRSSGPGLYWPDSGWNKGDLSKDSQRVSSFAVLDRMVEMYHGVAVIGHSAGGQFVTRYAAGTRMQGLMFVVANPSSYMWLNKSRPLGSASSCPWYNEYRYGLDDLNNYMSAGVAPDYPSRNVIYMLGDRDTVIDSNLDTTCYANRQGRHRYERGLNFYSHLAQHYGRTVHRKVIVPGVGHKPSLMIKAARPYLLQRLSQ